MKLFTWNVLHRVHAEVHGEPCIVHWADEKTRVDAVVAAVRALNCDVGLLQEVSGDVVAALRSAFPERAVLSHLYPRVPKRSVTGVKDRTEHLVVLAPAGAKVKRASTYESDPGKGFLAVDVDGVTLISTHVSWGEKRADQLITLRETVASIGGRCVVGGDFNIEREVVEPALGAKCVVLPSGSLPTRDQGTGPGLMIDHLLGFGVELRDARVEAHRNESDHRPVSARL
ncbi:MAG: endonuclease/exonuclease/phosphatase family protein [Archangium sp.]